MSEALHALRSHGARNKATGGFSVDDEAFAAASLAEDLFTGAVDVGGVDFADVSIVQSVVDFE